MFFEINTNGVTYMISSVIKCPHAFTTRIGGVSKSIYTSMNLGQSLGDDPNCVSKNYNIICNALGIAPDSLVKSKQEHGTYIRTVTEKDRQLIFSLNNPVADGMITDNKNVALIIYTADCVPILLHDPSENVICAVHAGWRGTVANIAGEAVKKLSNEFGCSPVNIKAAIGPCISQCCFETTKEVPDALFNNMGKSAKCCIKPNNEKFLVDLKEANRLMLIDSGVVDIDISDECTSCLSEKYWSHRKHNTHRGSQASIIYLGDF